MSCMFDFVKADLKNVLVNFTLSFYLTFIDDSFLGFKLVYNHQKGSPLLE